MKVPQPPAPWTLLMTVTMVTTMTTLCLNAPRVQAMGDRCNPTSESQRICMRGCLTCWKTYGGELYDMVSCCRECRSRATPLIDFAPSHCSLRHVQKTWLKRFG